MSSYKRRFLIMLPLVAILAACGFTPVYGPGQTGDALRGTVNVSEPANVNEFMLVQDLEERLGRPSDPKYDLKLQLSLRYEGLAISPSDSTTRFNIIGRVNYTLTDRATKKVISSDKVQNFVGYSAVGTPVETVASQRDALERLMTILADQLTVQLYSTLDLPS